MHPFSFCARCGMIHKTRCAAIGFPQEGSHMVLFIPKKAICACALAAALVTLAAVALRPSPDTVPASTAAEPRTMLVLDAGHGGEDGGAVSDSGVAREWHQSSDHAAAL